MGNARDWLFDAAVLTASLVIAAALAFLLGYYYATEQQIGEVDRMRALLSVSVRMAAACAARVP